jgi:hypothetical protein
MTHSVRAGRSVEPISPVPNENHVLPIRRKGRKSLQCGYAKRGRKGRHTVRTVRSKARDQLPGKQHGAPRGQQDVADGMRHRVPEYWQRAPGFILNRPQRRRYRSRTRADCQTVSWGYRGMISVNTHSIRSTSSRITRIAWRLPGYGIGAIASTA